MTMEKNGAISSDTPHAGSCCKSNACNGNACGSEKKGEAATPSSLELDLKFPVNASEARRMGDDLTNRLNESVERASKTSK